MFYYPQYNGLYGRSYISSGLNSRTYCLLDSLVVECWHPVPEIPGSIPSQGPRDVKDVIKMVPVVPLFSTQHLKGNTGSFLRIKIGQRKVMDKIWDGNLLKSEVIGHGSEDKQMNDHAEQKQSKKSFFRKK